VAEQGNALGERRPPAIPVTREYGPEGELAGRVEPGAIQAAGAGDTVPAGVRGEAGGATPGVMASTPGKGAEAPGLTIAGTGAALRRAGRALPRGAALGLAGVARLPLLVLAVAGLVLWFGLGLFPAFAGAVAVIRRAVNVARATVSRWCGVAVPVPYLPRPRLEQTERGWFWSGYDYHKRHWVARLSSRLRWLTGDPATWRDLAWLALDPALALAVALLPTALVAGGLSAWAYAGLRLAGEGSGLTAGLAVVIGVAAVVCGVSLAAPLLAAYGRLTAVLLRPVRRDSLAERVHQLTRTRADALAIQAAELRRIERDLHDGAQARIVAMRMTLAVLQPMIQRDPAAAEELAAELRESCARVLQELRDLVHGIHPPVLAERGLRDALRSLVLDLPLDATVDVDLPGRFEPAVEAAVYFTVSEALTNVVKHAGTRAVAVHLRYDDGVLRGSVVDEGQGGANLDAGTGLLGIQRRLAAFDGSLAVVSRPGGPTRVSLELPCVLSSPRTSSSSEMA